MPVPVSRWSWHRIVGVVVAVPMVWMCVTGVLYEMSLLLSLSQYGLDHDYVRAKWLLRLHQLSYFGSSVPAVYTGLLGCAVVIQSVTGMQRIKRVERNPSRWFRTMRKFHGIAGVGFVVLGTYTAITGSLYRVLRTWSNIPKQDLKWLLGLHHGHYFFGASSISLMYIVVVAMLVMGTVYSGISIVAKERTPAANRGAGWFRVLFPKEAKYSKLVAQDES